MRDPARIPRILKKLEKLWLKYPDQRLGQFLSNYIWPQYHQQDGSIRIFNIEDMTDKKFNPHFSTEQRLDELLE